MATMRLTIIKVPVRGVDRLRNSRLVAFDPRSIEKKAEVEFLFHNPSQMQRSVWGFCTSVRSIFSPRENLST